MGRAKQGVVCGAKTRGGGTCKNAAVVGFKRCRMHGAGGKAKGYPQLTSGLKHGRDAYRWRKTMTEQGVERIEELATSPAVLDIQRTAAVSQFLLEQHVSLEPTEDEIKALAVLKFRLADKVEPTDAQCQAVRYELLETIQKALDQHVSIQDRAKRQLTQEALIGLLVVPILATLGSEVMKVILRHVDTATAEKIQAEITDVRRNLTIRAGTQMEAAR